MHALRLHKSRVPREREKAREARRLQQATRQRGARSSVLQRLRSFLTADCFMYGPLVESPPTVLISDASEPHTPEREQESGGFDDGSTGEETNGVEENDANSGKNIINNGHEESAVRRRYKASKTILSVQRTSARMTARTDGTRNPASTVRVMRLHRNGT